MPTRPTRSIGARARSASTSARCFSSPTSRSGPARSIHVYLVPKPSIRREADVKDVMFVDLGRLRSFKGSQRYADPGRRRSEEISERGDLVRAVQRADLARRSQRRRASATSTGRGLPIASSRIAPCPPSLPTFRSISSLLVAGVALFASVRRRRRRLRHRRADAAGAGADAGAGAGGADHRALGRCSPTPAACSPSCVTCRLAARRPGASCGALPPCLRDRLWLHAADRPRGAVRDRRHADPHRAAALRHAQARGRARRPRPGARRRWAMARRSAARSAPA